MSVKDKLKKTWKIIDFPNIEPDNEPDPCDNCGGRYYRHTCMKCGTEYQDEPGNQQ